MTGDYSKSREALMRQVCTLRERVAELEEAQQQWQRQRDSGREQLERFGSIIENMPVMIDAFDSEGNVVLWNRECKRITGYSTAEIVGNPGAMERLYPDKSYREQMMQEWRERGSNYRDWEWTITCKDGSTKTLSWYNIAEQCPIEGWTTWGIGVDITERKQLENKLTEAKEFASGILEVMPEAVGVTDMQGCFLTVNKEFEKQSALKKEDLTGRTATEIGITTDEEFRRIQTQMLPLLRAEGLIHNLEITVTRADGTQFPALVSMALFGDVQGRPLGVVTATKDITKQKRTEQALRESEKKYRQLFENSPVGIYRTTPEGQIVMANPALVRMLGFSSFEELSGRNVEKTGFRKGRPRAEFIERVEKEGEVAGLESEWLRRDGSCVAVRESASVSRDKSGRTLYYEGIVQDVSERRRIERMLKEREAHLSYLISSSPAVIYTCEPGENYPTTFVSDNIREQLGYEPKDFTRNPAFWVNNIHPDDRQRSLRKAAEILDKGQMVHEYRFKHKNGSYRWMRDELKLMRDADGNPKELIGSWTDITEHKKTEEQIRVLSTAVRQSIDGLSIADLDDRITYANKAFARMHGYSVEEMIGMKIETLHDKEQLRQSDGVIHQVKTAGSWKGEMGHRRKDGTTFPTYMSVTLLKDESGKPTAMLGIVKDITEQKQAEERIRQSEESLSSMINAITESALLIDVEGTVLAVNKTTVERLKTKIDGLVGKCIHNFVPADVVGFRKQQMEQVVRTGEPVRFEDLRFGRRLDNSLYPVFDASGRVSRIAVFARDITEIKQKEQELNLYREKMARAEQLASLGTLSATLAHELTQPLTVINLSIQNSLAELEGTSCPHSASEGLDDALTAVSDLTSKLKRFGNFARTSSEKTLTEINLKTIAEKITVLLDEKAQRANVVLQIRDMDKLVPLYWHEKDIEQVFFNLLDNAIGAASGEKKRRVTVDGDVKDMHIELRFSDDCGGIAAEHIDRVFEPFFTTKPAGEGTGLGLCVVERIVTEAGGKVWVESRCGEGSTFFVRLPIGSTRP